MAKAKKINNQRITKSSKLKTGRKGRPKGTRKKRKFEETKLGFFLKYETPLEYDIIMSCTKYNVFKAPNVGLIDLVCSASDNTSFLKAKFFKYLEDYRKNNIYCDRPKTLTLERKVYYDKIRANKVKEYSRGKKIKLRAMFNSVK